MSVEPVEVTVVLRKTKREAFIAFTQKISGWWPLETHSVGPYLGEPMPQTVVLEPYEGGRIYEMSPTGIERVWGTITKWTEDEEIEFTWHPGQKVDRATTVNVTFQTTDNGATVVALRHSGWEVLAQEAQNTRDNYDRGWADILTIRYRDFAERQSPA
ncbi:MAG: SRPBCC domain-containing protein [Pseudomonadota bacterium]